MRRRRSERGGGLGEVCQREFWRVMLHGIACEGLTVLQVAYRSGRESSNESLRGI